MTHGHGHHAAVRRGQREDGKRRLRAALLVTGGFLAVEVVGGLLSGSLALLADATHMFADVAALMLAYAAMSLATRAPSSKYTFGLYRAEVLAAFVNAELLLVIAGYIFYEAYQRFYEPRTIATGIMMAVAVGGFMANLVAVRMLQGADRRSDNIRAAYLEVLADMLASVGVIAAGVAIAVTGWYWLDALVSGGIGLLVCRRTLGLLKESAHVLLEGTPPETDVRLLTRVIQQVPGVTELHDLHVWTLTSGLNAASLHIRVDDGHHGRTALAAVQRVLREHGGVEHATVQVEWGASGACETAELHF